MNPTVTFDKSLIAPCGMNCGTCIGYLRDKNRCNGCRNNSENNLKTMVNCIIKNCTHLEKTKTKFCYECERFPCKRMKQLDNRYTTKYRTSFIENLLRIKETGLTDFLVFESERRTCKNCGSTLSVHRSICLKCKIDIN